MSRYAEKIQTREVAATKVTYFHNLIERHSVKSEGRAYMANSHVIGTNPKDAGESFLRPIDTPDGIGLCSWHRSQLEGSMILPRQNSVRDRSSTARTCGCSFRGYEHDLIGRPDNLI